jgi:hypothetical protein
MVDLDVLVDPRQFDAAPRVLQGMGYTLASTAKRFEVNFHHAPYQHPTIPLTVEVHRHLDAVMAPAQAFGEGWWLSPV